MKEILLASPAREGRLHPLIAAAAQLCGITVILKIGGAQAIAALAYGTASVPRVDKIVGPGNAFVAAAKRIVFGEVSIDMIAGPSEVLIVADGSAPASFAAADLIAQAEHDETASAILAPMHGTSQYRKWIGWEPPARRDLVRPGAVRGFSWESLERRANRQPGRPSTGK